MPWEILVDETLVEISYIKNPTTIMLSLANRKQGWNIYSHYGNFLSQGLMFCLIKQLSE